MKPLSVILSVDDEPDTLKLRRVVLEKAGYEVLDAANGLEALRIFEARNVDLVLVDFYMPDLDGAAVANEVKDKRPDVPVILVSGSVECFDQMRRKVEGIIFKGSSPEIMLAEIKRLLGPSRVADDSAA